MNSNLLPCSAQKRDPFCGIRSREDLPCLFCPFNPNLFLSLGLCPLPLQPQPATSSLGFDRTHPLEKQGSRPAKSPLAARDPSHFPPECHPFARFPPPLRTRSVTATPGRQLTGSQAGGSRSQGGCSRSQWSLEPGTSSNRRAVCVWGGFRKTSWGKSFTQSRKSRLNEK